MASFPLIRFGEVVMVEVVGAGESSRLRFGLRRPRRGILAKFFTARKPCVSRPIMIKVNASWDTITAPGDKKTLIISIISTFHFWGWLSRGKVFVQSSLLVKVTHLPFFFPDPTPL